MTSKKNKFINQTYQAFKKSSLCFSPLQNRTVQGKAHFIMFSNDLVLVDFGFKSEVQFLTNELHLHVYKLRSFREKISHIQKYAIVEFNILTLQSSFFRDVSIQSQKRVIDFKFFQLYFVQQQQKKIKRKSPSVKGRLLNSIRGGFSVGICGYIAFLPLSHSLHKDFGKMSLFHILAINPERSTFVVSQKKMDKILRERLKTLGSRLAYVQKIRFEI